MFAGHWIEAVLVLAIALIFLGPKRLPDAGRSLGQAIRGFRDETKGIREELSPIKDDVVGLRDDVAKARETVKSTVSESITGKSAQ